MLQRMPSPLHGACNGCHSLAIGCLLLPQAGVRSFGQPATLGPGPLGFATGGVRHVCRLVKLENLVPQPKSFEALPRDLLRPMPALQQLLLGGKSDD